MSTVRVKVCDGWGVYFDGEAHSGGAVIDIPDDLAREWADAGWVTKEPATKPKATSKRTAKRNASGSPRRPS